MLAFIILGVFASYRIDLFFTQDVIMAGFRERVFKKWPPAPNKLSYILTCTPWCFSVYSSILVVALWLILPLDWWIPIMAVPAFSCIIGLIEEHR